MHLCVYIEMIIFSIFIMLFTIICLLVIIFLETIYQSSLLNFPLHI